MPNDYGLPNFFDFNAATWFTNPFKTSTPQPSPSPTPDVRTIQPAPITGRGQGDVVSAAMSQQFNPSNASYFPAANRMLYAQSSVQANQDLANQIDGTFYGGGNAPQPSPTPSATPSSAKPTQMNLAQLMDHFGVQTAGQNYGGNYYG